jgi:hypothetical protein
MPTKYRDSDPLLGGVLYAGGYYMPVDTVGSQIANGARCMISGTSLLQSLTIAAHIPALL